MCLIRDRNCEHVHMGSSPVLMGSVLLIFLTFCLVLFLRPALKITHDLFLSFNTLFQIAVYCLETRGHFL
jgi:hypothetical protein